MKTLPLLALALTTVMLMGCKKDIFPPTVAVESPQEHTSFNKGETVDINADFSELNDLKSFRVWVGDEDGNAIAGFTFEESGDISGILHMYSGAIPIPTNATVSEFYVHFEVEDVAGNVGTEAWMLHIN